MKKTQYAVLGLLEQTTKRGNKMKSLTYWEWLIAYKIIVKLEKYAYKHKMYSQINECINIENSMMHYKSVMYDKDLL